MILENLTLEELEELKELVNKELVFREEAHARLLRDYENDTLVCEGWSQQDTINMYRQGR